MEPISRSTPDYPADRIALILTDAQPALLITTSDTAQHLPTTTIARMLLGQPRGNGMY